MKTLEIIFILGTVLICTVIIGSWKHVEKMQVKEARK